MHMNDIFTYPYAPRLIGLIISKSLMLGIVFFPMT